MASGEAPANPFDQLWVIEEVIDRLE